MWNYKIIILQILFWSKSPFFHNFWVILYNLILNHYEQTAIFSLFEWKYLLRNSLTYLFSIFIIIFHKKTHLILIEQQRVMTQKIGHEFQIWLKRALNVNLDIKQRAQIYQCLIIILAQIFLKLILMGLF